MAFQTECSYIATTIWCHWLIVDDMADASFSRAALMNENRSHSSFLLPSPDTLVLEKDSSKSVTSPGCRAYTLGSREDSSSSTSRYLIPFAEPSQIVRGFGQQVII